MINLPLNPKVFAPDVEKVPIRKGFGEGLLEAGARDHRVVALCADLTESTQMHHFAEKFPERFIEVGIGEQNLASVASGMAAMGKVPFFSSYAMFSPGRNWEQIRTTICYNHVNAKIVGSHAGVSVGPDGGTHQAIEDIAITRVIPRMLVIAPCDHIEARKATIALAGYDGPAYIRLAREGTPVVTSDETPFELGRAETLWSPEGQAVIGIVSTGSLTHNALMAAKELSEAGIPTKHLHMATIKPLDTEALLALASEVRGIITVEEHQKVGGLGGAVAEFLGENKPTKMIRIGVDDRFGESGKPDELVEHFGMGISHIVTAGRALHSGK
jgi:transketolase